DGHRPVGRWVAQRHARRAHHGARGAAPGAAVRRPVLAQPSQRSGGLRVPRALQPRRAARPCARGDPCARSAHPRRALLRVNAIAPLLAPVARWHDEYGFALADQEVRAALVRGAGGVLVTDGPLADATAVISAWRGAVDRPIFIAAELG